MIRCAAQGETVARLAPGLILAWLSGRPTNLLFECVARRDTLCVLIHGAGRDHTNPPEKLTRRISPEGDAAGTYTRGESPLPGAVAWCCPRSEASVRGSRPLGGAPLRIPTPPPNDNHAMGPNCARVHPNVALQDSQNHGPCKAHPPPNRALFAERSA